MKRFKIDLQALQESNHLNITTESFIDKLKSFVEKAISSQSGIKDSIEELKGSNVGQSRTIEDGGRYSGLKLIDTDKVDSKSIIKYLELIKHEILRNVKSFSSLIDLLEKIRKNQVNLSEEQLEQFKKKYYFRRISNKET